jgi:hypothetical protein
MPEYALKMKKALVATYISWHNDINVEGTVTNISNNISIQVCLRYCNQSINRKMHRSIILPHTKNYSAESL